LVKRIIAVLLAFSALLSMAACKKDTVYGHAEMRISLPESFSEFESESFDATYSDGKSLVGILRVSFDAGFNQGIPDFLTPEEFAKLYMKSTGRDSEIKLIKNVPYYEYTELQDGVKNAYIASFFRSKYAYFVVVFATVEELYSSLAGELLSYTETVIFVY